METAIQFRNVSKRFTIYHERPRSFQEVMIRLLNPRSKKPLHEDFWALRDVTFDIPKGKTVGLIGTNGSGKSTALKLMSGILQPTEGEISVYGRISALLELGSGMHPELTGRENIFLNGSLLGVSNSEMEQLYPRILHFSELERFIDMPVKHYSSGMYMRLGFSVAIHVHPDILLLDEVLTVGDQSFQTKCLDRIYEMKKRGTTIVIVSHAVNTLQDMCDELIWLRNGVLVGQGDSDEVGMNYTRYVHGAHVGLNEQVWGEGVEDVSVDEDAEDQWRWGSREVEITGVRFRRGDELTDTFFTGDPFTLEIDYLAHERVDDPMFGLAIHHRNGTHIAGPNNKFAHADFDSIRGVGTVRYTIPDLPLLEGSYEVSVSAYDNSGMHAFDVHWRVYPFHVRPGGSYEQYGLFRVGGEWEHEQEPTSAAGEEIVAPLPVMPQ